MHVSLTPELENLVKKQVESGRYHSSSEVIREALHLRKEQEKLRKLRIAQFRKDIQAGLESGSAEELDFKDIKKRGNERVRNKKEGVEWLPVKNSRVTRTATRRRLPRGWPSGRGDSRRPGR